MCFHAMLLGDGNDTSTDLNARSVTRESSVITWEDGRL